MNFDQPTNPPCDDDPEDADTAFDAYLVEQAGEVVRSEIGEDWRTWSLAQCEAYLAQILWDDFAHTAAKRIAARDAAAFLRLCRREQDRLDAEDDDAFEGPSVLAYDPIAAEEE